MKSKQITSQAKSLGVRIRSTVRSQAKSSDLQDLDYSKLWNPIKFNEINLFKDKIKAKIDNLNINTKDNSSKNRFLIEEILSVRSIETPRRETNNSPTTWRNKAEVTKTEPEEMSPTGTSDDTERFFYLREPRIYQRKELGVNRLKAGKEMKIRKTKVIIEKTYRFSKHWKRLNKEYNFNQITVRDLSDSAARTQKQQKGKLLHGLSIIPSKTPAPKLFHNLKLSSP